MMRTRGTLIRHFKFYWLVKDKKNVLPKYLQEGAQYNVTISRNHLLMFITDGATCKLHVRFKIHGLHLVLESIRCY